LFKKFFYKVKKVIQMTQIWRECRKINVHCTWRRKSAPKYNKV